MLSLCFRLLQYARNQYLHNKKTSLERHEQDHEQDECETNKEQHITGFVTKLNNQESYGIINQDIYFNFDTLCGDEVNIGAKVFVHATRENVDHGWKAVSVQVYKSFWDSDDKDSTLQQSDSWLQEEKSEFEEEHVKSIEGEITEWYGLFGIIDNTYRFGIQDCEIDFKPVVGDFITATVCNQKVIKWRPKSKIQVEGVVTAHEIDCGIVNKNIIFFLDSCYCDVPYLCGMKVLVDAVESKQQSFNWRAFRLKSASTEEQEQSTKLCFTDRPGLYISNNLNFHSLEIGQEKSVSVVIKNEEAHPLCFLHCKLQKVSGNSQFSVCDNSVSVIPSHSEFKVEILCRAEGLGRHNALVLFEFEQFLISRTATVFVRDPMQRILNPTAPFSHQNSKCTYYNVSGFERVIIPGEKPHLPKANFLGHKPQYAIPRYLWKIVEENSDITQALPILLKTLEPSNYTKKLSCLLHLEEIQMNIHMQSFDMHEVVLLRRGEFLCLEVPGLAEGRPSLLMGDRAMLLPPNNSTFMYEGYIHEVHKNDIFLKFNENFHSSYNDEIYDVTFRFSRSNIKMLHENINIIFHKNCNLLFPKYLKLQKPLVEIFPVSGASEKKKANERIVKWQNKILNSQQKEAVKRILEMRCRPLPYIIFGPPGTGKTVTVVEAILQVYLTFANARILVCTPSNSAADLIAQRLIESEIIDVAHMVRINSYQRNVDSIPEFIKPFCQDKETVDDAVKFPIVISTCTTAGAFHKLELAPDHFTHLFIDEAGQLTEPETMVPISIIVNHRNASLILAGDPKQLGPVLLSKISKTYGLQMSYLERIMQSHNYLNNRSDNCFHGQYNPYFVTMLICSYRSHPAILQYPSRTFYFSQVTSSKQDHCDNNLENCELLPKKGFPVIFHGIRGEESREENSPSWFNSSEVVQVCQYLRGLYKLGLTSSEVGIIAPYKKQVEKIRLLASALDVELCKIGSVEEFQGQERRAIIISAVRSSEDFLHYDVLYHLGFLCSPKRFNVAVTRAKSLLVVIGNPYVLALDSVWNGFIKYCKFNGGYTGCDISLLDLERIRM